MTGSPTAPPSTRSSRRHSHAPGGRLTGKRKAPTSCASSRARLERQNLDQLSKLVAEVRPDAALVWGMWNVPRAVPALLEQLLGSRVVFYFCDYWPTLPSAYL